MEEVNATENAQIGQHEARLVESARQALENAYAPYSGFRVGAAVETALGQIYSGCNVENASYGLTMCAERAAVFAAVRAEGPKCRVLAIALATEVPTDCAPCGACRQVLAEFGPTSVVIFPGLDGYRISSLGRLLPYQFRLPQRRQ